MFYDYNMQKIHFGSDCLINEKKLFKKMFFETISLI